MKKRLVHRFTAEQAESLRTLSTLIAHYEAMHRVLQQDLVKQVAALSGRDMETGDYQLDLVKGLLYE
jgi:hypothetical protein